MDEFGDYFYDGNDASSDFINHGNNGVGIIYVELEAS